MMVKRKNIFFHPVKRQIFGDASGKTSALILTVCHNPFPHSVSGAFFRPMQCFKRLGTGVYFVTNYLGHVGVPGQSWKKLDHNFSASFGYSTNSSTPTPTTPTPTPNIYAFSGGLSANECKYLNERDHKIYTASQSMGGRVNFFFPTWKTGPGAYSDQRETPGDTWNTPKKWFFCPKEAERGWKSDATPLSWKSRWKPSTREEFWHQRI